MPTTFRRLAEGFFVAPQISIDDVARAAALGIRTIVNNRPDGEEEGQPSGAAIEAAARANGIAYIAIPMRVAAALPEDVARFAAAMNKVDGPILGYCRTGTRSTALRAFARVRGGADIESVLSEALAAGYDLSALAPHLEAARPAEKSVNSEP